MIRIDVGAFIKKHPHPQYNSYLIDKLYAGVD